MKTVPEQINSLEKPAVVVTVGYPGIGKSTEVDKIVEQLGEEMVAVISSDDIRDELYQEAHPEQKVKKRDPRAFKEIPGDKVFAEADKRTAAAFAAGKVVIMDSTGLSRDKESDFRRKTIERYRMLGARTVAALDFAGSVEDAKRGNELRNAAGGGYVDPGDIDKMQAFRQAHPLTPDAPGEFDIVILQPYTQTNRTQP